MTVCNYFNYHFLSLTNETYQHKTIKNKGFFWINYDDFFDFVADVYSILDYGTDASAPETQIETETVVSPKSLTVVTNKPVTNNIIEADPAKPRLKGNIEFLLMKPTGDFETVPVNKTAVDTRGQLVENDNGQKVAYACVFRSILYHHSAAKFTSVPGETLPSIPLESLPLIPG